MLVIRDVNAPPPERFHYPVAATGGTIIDAGNYNQLFENVKKHCSANNVPYPGDQAIIDYLCANTHVSCYESTTRVAFANKLTMGLPYTAPSCCGKK